VSRTRGALKSAAETPITPRTLQVPVDPEAANRCGSGFRRGSAALV